MTFGQQVKEARGLRSQEEAARVLIDAGLKVSMRALAGYERGETKPDGLKQKAILQALRDAGGDGSTSAAALAKPSASSAVVQQPVTILLHDVEAACGPPLLVESHTEANGHRFTMEREFLAGLLGFDPPPLMRALRAKGRSMEPYIGDGRWCLYEPVDEMVNGQRHVFQIEEEATGDWYLYIKRLQRLLGGGVKVISDNPLSGVDDETLIPDGPSKGKWMRHAVTDSLVRLHVAGVVLWPDGENSRESMVIDRAIDRLVKRGVIKPGL